MGVSLATNDVPHLPNFPEAVIQKVLIHSPDNPYHQDATTSSIPDMSIPTSQDI